MVVSPVIATGSSTLPVTIAPKILAVSTIGVVWLRAWQSQRARAPWMVTPVPSTELQIIADLESRSVSSASHL